MTLQAVSVRSWIMDIFLGTGGVVTFGAKMGDGIIYHQLGDVDVEICTDDEKCVREALRQAGVSATILSTAVQKEVLETFQIFAALMQGDAPTFRQVKQSLLGQTEAFRNADNIRRVRALIQAHLERLQADERFPGFFAYSNQIEV